MSRPTVRRDFRDLIFNKLFTHFPGWQEEILGTGNFLLSTDYRDPGLVQNVKMGRNTLFNRPLNDLSFLIGRAFLLIIEHQSTRRSCIPFILQIYFGYLLEEGRGNW